jgi:hypothetical protein
MHGRNYAGGAYSPQSSSSSLSSDEEVDVEAESVDPELLPSLLEPEVETLFDPDEDEDDEGAL